MSPALFLHQFGNTLVRPHANQQMDMVGHTVDSDHRMAMMLNNAGYVGIEPVFPRRMDDRRPEFHGKHKLNVQLGVCISHSRKGYASETFSCYVCNITPLDNPVMCCVPDGTHGFGTMAGSRR